MREQIEGSRGVARAVAACRPGVVCAYPITPQTHIVEGLGAMVRAGQLAGCSFINVESELAALSVAIGSSAVGVRTYTATASQGLLYMSEAVHNAAGLGLPIVMTVANRAIGAPINIWNDHSDSMALRDAGWIQLHARSNQEAADLHVIAFRLAEEISVPVMVCMDGFVLTHAFEPIDVLTAAEVDTYLPPFAPRQVLDPAAPLTIGAMVGPEAYTEVRYLAHLRQMAALHVMPRLAAAFDERFGRRAGGLVHGYRLDDADTVVVVLGSVFGTVCDVVDQLREAGQSIGALAITTYRPFPSEAVRDALRHASQVVVIERAFAPGRGGFVTPDVRSALPTNGTPCRSVVAGLGGRPVLHDSLVDVLSRAPHLDDLTFLDLDHTVIARELGVPA